MKVSEMKKIFYDEYREAVEAIIKASREMRPEGEHKVEENVAIDYLITFVDNNEKSIFVNVPEAKARLAELRAKISE